MAPLRLDLDSFQLRKHTCLRSLDPLFATRKRASRALYPPQTPQIQLLIQTRPFFGFAICKGFPNKKSSRGDKQAKR